MFQKIHSKLKSKKGFTLIEMIVVIAIIAVLIALVAPQISKYIGTAKQTNADAMAKSLYTATQAYMAEAQLNGESIQTAEYTKDSAETAKILEYVSEKDAKKITNITIKITDGSVESVNCTLEGKTGKHPHTQDVQPGA